MGSYHSHGTAHRIPTPTLSNLFPAPNPHLSPWLLTPEPHPHQIAPNYSTIVHPVIHVLDASRSVTVVGSLLGEDKPDYVQDILDEYDELREEHYAGLEERLMKTHDQVSE